MYKVGDKVKVKENLEVGVEYDMVCFNRGMKKYCGKTFTITSVLNMYGKNQYSLGKIARCWSEGMLEPIGKQNKMYVIKKNESFPIEFIDCKDCEEVCKIISKEEGISKDELQNLSNSLCEMKYKQWIHFPKYHISILCVSEDFFTTPKIIKK